MVWDRAVEAAAGRRRDGGGTGYRIKNKNPTQRCGEKNRNEHFMITGTMNPQEKISSMD